MVALQKLGKTEEAKELVKKMVAAADAKTAAAAFNARAAMLAAEGSRKEAVLDYMKTLLLCKEEEAAEERATARAAVKELLKQLNDNRAAEIDNL